MPSNFCSLTSVMFEFPTLSERGTSGFSLLLFENTINVVFASLATRELLAMKERIWRASDSNLDSMFSNVSSMTVAELSSANPEIVECSDHKSMSLNKIMNSTGEMTLPCGDPTLIIRTSEMSFPMHTN